MYDIVALGEILIDFSPNGTDERGFPVYIQNPGGAVANIAAVCASYGAETALIGRVGKDLFGTYLKQFLSGLGVDCTYVSEDPDYNTTLAFVSLDANGDRDFAFYRRHEADLRLSCEDFPSAVPEHTKIFHFGSLSMTAEPARTATYHAVRAAKAAGALISYDPNYRASLWAGQDAVFYMRDVLKDVDLVKVSGEEGEMITGQHEPSAIAEALLAMGPRFAAVTLGADGAYYADANGGKKINAYGPVHTIDTTGAGDVFWGTVLVEYLRTEFAAPALTERSVRRACRAAALCTEHKGAASSIPPYAAVTGEEL